MKLDQVQFAILSIVGISALSIVALYISPEMFKDYGGLVVGIAIGAIAGLAGNTLTK